MKHLKRFNEAKDLNTIKDICLELEDIGMLIRFDQNWLYSKHKGSYLDFIDFLVPISLHKNKDIEWEDVKDCILRLKDYLGDRFVTFTYRLFSSDYIREVGLNDHIIIDGPLQEIIIEYRV